MRKRRTKRVTSYRAGPFENTLAIASGVTPTSETELADAIELELWRQSAIQHNPKEEIAMGILYMLVRRGFVMISDPLTTEHLRQKIEEEQTKANLLLKP